ncbi:hypothetical protein FBY58_1412 [Zymomonas mobilis]|uniref:Uncharacterized protein n=1 Tax=Zymomonas mobilis TaxID=542 RepID=A0A542W2L4_ZYMMB|nr:hypothetical protein FBY58_1412 [Zymomonas mobilis]
MFDREKSYLSVFNIVPFTMLLSLPGWFFLFVYLNKIGIFPYFLKNINIPSIVFISISIIAIYAILFLFSFFSSMCFFVFLHPIFSGKQIILHFYFFRIPIQNIRTKWDVWKTEKIIKKCLNRSFLIICHIIFFIYFLYMIF